MKPQDILFFAVLAFLLYKRDSRWFAVFGILSLFLAIPLFAEWIFFTAQRLVSYAFVFFLFSTLLHLLNTRKS
ncbi:MAG: hypothetical protein AAB801_01085 [Patescibacteria group bacterium]